MKSTLQNAGQIVSLAMFLTIVISSLSASLPSALSNAMVQAVAPQLAPIFQKKKFRPQRRFSARFWVTTQFFQLPRNKL